LLIIMIGIVIQGIIVGFIRSVFDIAGIILGFILAVNYSEAFGFPRFLSFLLIFILVVIGISLLGRIISKLIHLTPLGCVDKILGAFLGLLKAFIISFAFLTILFLLKRSDAIIYESKIAPFVVRCGLTASQILPRKLHRWIKKVVTKRELVLCQMQNYKDEKLGSLDIT